MLMPTQTTRVILQQYEGKHGKYFTVLNTGVSQMTDIMHFRRSDPPLANAFYSLSCLTTGNAPAAGSRWRNASKDFAVIDFLAIDIDGCPSPVDHHVARIADWLEARYAVELNNAERYSVASGHGLHWLVRIPPQADARFFTKIKPHYHAWCLILQRELYRETGIICKVDYAIYEAARLLRLPGTINKKDGQLAVRCELLSSKGDIGVTSAAMLNVVYATEPILKSTAFDKLLDDVLKQCPQHKDGGHYYAVCCPWHPEQHASLVIFKESHVAIDYHDQRRVALTELLSKLTGTTVTLKDYGLQPILNLLEEHLGSYQFNIRDNQRTAIYSALQRRWFTQGQMLHTFTHELLERFQQQAIECLPPVERRMSFNRMSALYHTWAAVAFQRIFASLPAWIDTSPQHWPPEEVERWKLNLHKLFHTPRMMFDQERVARRSIYRALSLEPLGTDDWQRLNDYCIFYRGQKAQDEYGMILDIGMTYRAVVECDPKWAEAIGQPERFYNIMEELGLGQREMIAANGMTVMVCRLKQEFIRSL
jgi:hypothetical protein